MTVARVVLVVAVLAAAALVGVAWQRRNGRFTAVPKAVLAAADLTDGPHVHGPGVERLTSAEIGVEPGTRATFVQLSSEVCTPCRRTHAVLADLAVQHGFDRAEALRVINDPDELAVTEGLARQAAEQGINGVPFFVFGEKYAMSGAQPQEVFGMALAKTLNEL